MYVLLPRLPVYARSRLRACKTLTNLPFADVAGLQQQDGSFWGDEWGEVDTRRAAFTTLFYPHPGGQQRLLMPPS